MRVIARAIVLAFLCSILAAPFAVRAVAQSSPAPAGELLKAEQLDQLVAQIALYPDSLLAEVLMASTYPLEIVSADRWVKQNSKLKDEALKTAAEKQGWDESIVSLTATPEVLAMMSTQLDWTQQLGDAVLAQQPDVMDAIQRLRAKAQEQKKLVTTEQQKVTVTQQQNKQIIVIEPTNPATIYVPYYDPAVVYGAWPYPAYPPYYYPPPGYIAGAAIATGVAFGVGYAVGRWASGGNYWGGGFGWGNNDINIDNSTNINIDRKKFEHNAEHRHGVKYKNANVENKFGNRTNAKADQRIDFRGRDGKEVLRPDRDGPGGNRPDIGKGGADIGKGGRPDIGKGGGADLGKGGRPDAGKGGGRPDLGKQAARPSAPKADIARPQAPRPNIDRPDISGRGGNAFSHAGGGGGAAMQHSSRGRASVSSHGGGRGGGGGGGRGGGGRR
jgi:hypothetical protein